MAPTDEHTREGVPAHETGATFTCALVITVFLIVTLHLVLQVFSALHGF